jgi:hypothetical protein
MRHDANHPPEILLKTQNKTVMLELGRDGTRRRTRAVRSRRSRDDMENGIARIGRLCFKPKKAKAPS